MLLGSHTQKHGFQGTAILIIVHLFHIDDFQGSSVVRDGEREAPIQRHECQKPVSSD
jgi:hypothetical protein